MALHAVLIAVSYAAFFAAVVTGMAFLVQERRLKLKDPRVLRSEAVSLEMLDWMNRWAVIVGFAFFSVVIVQGHLLARRSWAHFRFGDPTEIWSALTWCAYAVVLALRLQAGLRGRRVVFMSVMSFLVAIFTVVGVSHLLGGRHLLF